MTFIDPSLDKVFNTLVNNDELISHLKKNDLLITKKSLYSDYTPEKVAEMELSIYTNNVSTLYNLAQTLLDNSEAIKSNEIWYLLSNNVAWDEIGYALGIDPKSMSSETYKLIIYTYKYCVVSSFFQNNRDKFIPEADFIMMEKNPAATAFYDAMMKEFDKIDTVIAKCSEYLSYDDIPYDLINYLTQLCGWEKKDILADDDTEMYFRELAKNIIDIYRIKGTNYSFELFFNFLGFNIKIKEYYFDRRLYYSTLTGNKETDESDNSNYEFYLTVNNPSDNKLQNLGIGEVVSEADITEQYSLHEFNELCNTYGVTAVLGYSPVYPIYDSEGNIMEYKEYTGKVYKYFKTNAIYYTISLSKANPTEKQITAVTKYLDFLTPSYVMKKLTVETYELKDEESIGFDGDGDEEADIYGNYNGFTILDSEDWQSHFADQHVVELGGINKVLTGEYDGEEPVYKEYTNSSGGNKFRLPLGHKNIAKSTSRYLTGGTGTPYPLSRRVKYYILHTLDEKETDDWGAENVVITPYYTVPPYIGSDNYVNMETSWLKKTTNVNLTGGDGKGGEDCVKTQIRDAELRTPIDYVTEKTIDDFLEDEEFNELLKSETFAKFLTKTRTIKYAPGTKYSNAYEAYLYEINQKEIHLCNISCDINTFKNEVVAKSTETYNSNKSQFESEIYADADLKKYFKNGIIKTLNFGYYVLSYAGTLEDGSLIIYRYGYTPYPIKKDEEQYISTYLNYLNSFDYDVVEAYKDEALLSVNFITKSSLDEVYSYISGARNTMIEAAINKSSDNWYELDYVTSKLFYVADKKKYYRAVKKPASTGKCLETYNSGKNHIFETMDKADAYFNNYPEEKINNAEFYITSEKKLYNFKYKNRTIGKLVYSITDEQLYYIHGASKQDVKKIDNFFGHLSIVEDNGTFSAYIDKYDQYWKGYDETADSEDFIFYNAEHTITWDELNINNKYIKRPIKYLTDKDFEDDEINYKNEYKQGDNADSYKLINGSLKYYNTFGQRIIDEIAAKTVDCFTNREHVNWYEKEYKKSGTTHAGGLLSIIESNIENLVGKEHNKEFNYYGKTSDFFQDYYRMIILGNLQKSSIPEDILADLINKPYDEITDEDITSEIKNNIKKYYNQAIIQCGDILENISKDRVYYSKIGNWKDVVTNKNVVNWEVLPKDGDNPDYVKVYENPLENDIYGEKAKQVIDGCYYFNTKTNFLTSIVANKNSLKEKYGDFIVFDIDKSLLGKDTYSLSDVNPDMKHIDTYKYDYMKSGKKTTLTINDFYFVRDNAYNYYIPYSLKYGLGQYSKDFYNEHRDIYSEFTELFDLFYAFAAPNSDRTKKDIDDYLKLYYYKKLTELYREAPVEDKLPISLESAGKKPTNIYPKLAETFNGKAGKFSNSFTLLSSYRQSGDSYDNLKLNFFKLKSSYTSDFNTLSLSFYVTKENFINAFGYDFNRYYKYVDLSNLSSAKIKILNAEIEEMYKKQFACIRPHFFFKKNIYSGNTLTNWQKSRINFEVDYSTASVDNIDTNYKSITDSNGYVIDANGNRIYNPETIQERLAESKYLIITVSLDTPGTTSSTAIFRNMSGEEENVNGYITVKKLTQAFNDNYVSKSYYNDWIEKNSENEPTEYISFGDDRSVTITYTNKTVTEDEYENYYKGTSETRKHDDSYPQFDEYKRVLTTSGQYVNFDKTKTFLDQNIEPEYEHYSGDVVLDADGGVAKQVRFTSENGEAVTVDSDIEFYYDKNGDLICSVSPGVISTGNITSLRLLYKILYIKIKYRRIFARAFIRNKIYLGQNFVNKNKFKILLNSVFARVSPFLKKTSYKFKQLVNKGNLANGFSLGAKIVSKSLFNLKNYFGYILKLKNIKETAKIKPRKNSKFGYNFFTAVKPIANVLNKKFFVNFNFLRKKFVSKELIKKVKTEIAYAFSKMHVLYVNFKINTNNNFLYSFKETDISFKPNFIVFITTFVRSINVIDKIKAVTEITVFNPTDPQGAFCIFGFNLNVNSIDVNIFKVSNYTNYNLNANSSVINNIISNGNIKIS